MPLYEYRCSSCGHQQEFLQKWRDAPLTTCTSCGKETFSKMLSAAGFQLKGSGWYATDFKNSGKPKGNGEAKAEAKTEAKSDSKADTTSEAKGKDAGPSCGAGGCSACQ
jgi:putative FmdB family regulatory protein